MQCFAVKFVSFSSFPGHGKFETLGALGISCMLLATAGGIAWHAFDLLQVCLWLLLVLALKGSMCLTVNMLIGGQNLFNIANGSFFCILS